MAKVYDILIDEDLDAQILDGDFVTGESTEQHQNLLLLAEKGSFVATPLVGVGLQGWINEDAGADELRHVIQQEVEGDGQKIQRLAVPDLENIELEAGYE